MARSAPTIARPKAAKPKLLTYRYTARGAGNRLAKGFLQAVSEIGAQNLLIERGYTPVSIEPGVSPFSLEGAFPSFFGIKPRQVISFSRQLATLLDSGVSLLPALQLLEANAPAGAAFTRLIRTIYQDLGTGKSFSQAVARHPTVFSEIYIRTIAVSERTGNLPAILKEMSEFMEKQAAFGKKIGKALTMPLITLAVAGGVILVLLTQVLPKMSDLFTAVGTKLPLPTRILMTSSDFVAAYNLYLLAGIIMFGALYYWASHNPRGRRILDQVKLKAPLIGGPIHLAELARLCRTMSVLLAAGVLLQEVFDLLPQTTKNLVSREALNQVKRGLLLGQGLTHPMSNNPFFPPLMLQMVRVGEESNALEHNLTVLSDFYEQTADEATSMMVGMIGPLSTFLFGGIGAFVALALILPMQRITSGVGA